MKPELLYLHTHLFKEICQNKNCIQFAVSCLSAVTHQLLAEFYRPNNAQTLSAEDY